tara:strand:+ start:386 stop:571 length:186 start_codon:yes stop_codon:yes gene_type:complete
MNGKGSKRRPHFVPLHEIGENWARIFEKQKQTEKEKENADSKRTESGKGRDPNNGRDGRND